MATINGTSKNFIIRVVDDNGGGKNYIFSHKFKELRYYAEDVYKTPEGSGRARSGKLLSQFKWVINYYEIDFSEFIEDEDAYKVQAVLNAETEGKKLFITPSLDILSRFEEIAQSKNRGSAGKKELTQRFRSDTNRGSKGLVLTYESVYPQGNFNWEDPANVRHICLKNLFINI
jgi:hypothetical protein